ncbi:hypothetical protein BXY85_1535 [Roseivirga pacifica]|uniref:Uncharacterized protein n=1 Tax=Roseivirga pacifica TaxID=1267423 RepID=A0A1I0MM01_9BACT|nr:hypothetical protein [Roseivirga pacifica]RKQ50519.1 hypothetical protein BXY85_1535 [Roseivirga pacifica]SEV89391.1 hypothetical protein SAMN05216290_0519 [Roseivirga pacifica]
MNGFYYDMFLSGLTYVILVYLAFRLMRKRKRPNIGGDDGGQRNAPKTPILDLPPGIIWHSDLKQKEDIPV